MDAAAMLNSLLTHLGLFRHWASRLSERLAEFLKSGGDWERKATTVPGVFVLKLPPFRGSPARLAVELNPVDKSGQPTKRRGLVIRSSEELEGFRRLLGEEKLTSLMRSIDEVNGPTKKRELRGDVLEI